MGGGDEGRLTRVEGTGNRSEVRPDGVLCDTRHPRLNLPRLPAQHRITLCHGPDWDTHPRIGGVSVKAQLLQPTCAWHNNDNDHDCTVVRLLKWLCAGLAWLRIRLQTGKNATRHAWTLHRGLV